MAAWFYALSMTLLHPCIRNISVEQRELERLLTIHWWNTPNTSLLLYTWCLNELWTPTLLLLCHYYLKRSTCKHSVQWGSDSDSGFIRSCFIFSGPLLLVLLLVVVSLFYCFSWGRYVLEGVLKFRYTKLGTNAAADKLSIFRLLLINANGRRLLRDDV